MRTFGTYYCRYSCALLSAIVCALSLVACTNAHAQAFAWYPSSTLGAGSGIEINTPAIQKDTAVQFDELDPAADQGTTSPQLNFDASQIASTRALETFLTFDFDLDANYLLFSGGTNVPWLTAYNFQGPSLVWGLRGYADYGRYSLKNASLTPDAKGTATNPSFFEAQYGDAYVSQIRKAALITVIFSIDDPSPATIAELEKSFGSGLTYSITAGQVSGNFDQFLSQAIACGTVHFLISAHGGPPIATQTGIIGSVVDITTLDGLLTQYGNGITASNVAPVVYYTSPYTALGVTLPAPPPSTVQKRLEDLANRYYSAAQQKQKIESIIGNWNAQYAYLDRHLFATYQSDEEQLTNYLASLVAIAPKVRDAASQADIPELPSLNIPWPNPLIDFSYHVVTVNMPATNTVSKYTVLDGTVHNAVVKEILLVKGSTTVHDLAQSQEDMTYLMAHIEDNNFLYNDQFYGNQGILPGTNKSDTYVMRWVLGSPTTDPGSLTAVALDVNGHVIAVCPLRHIADKNLAAPPPNQLSE